MTTLSHAAYRFRWANRNLKLLAAAVGILTIGSMPAQNQEPASEMVLRDLAPTGSLRFAFLRENVPMATVG